MKGKSLAAAYLCKWICNVVIYNAIFKKVKPLMDTAEAAENLANRRRLSLQLCSKELDSLTRRSTP